MGSRKYEITLLVPTLISATTDIPGNKRAPGGMAVSVVSVNSTQLL
jgi:hypothetical protein